MCLVVVACIGSLAVPVYADELSSSNWFNVLDYSLPNGGSYKYFKTSSGFTDVSFSLPANMTLYNVNLVLRTSSKNFSVSVVRNGVAYPLNAILISSDMGNLYRIIGDIGGVGYNPIVLRFSTPSPVDVIFEHFSVSSLRYDSFDDTLNAVVSVGSTLTATLTPDNADGYASIHYPVSSVGGVSSALAYVTCPNWKKYDFLDIYLSVYGYTLESVLVRLGDASVPFTISYIGQSGTPSKGWSFIVRLDLRNVPLNTDELPTIRVDHTIQNASGGSFVLNGCVGYVDVSYDPTFQFFGSWFKQFLSELSSIDNILSWLSSSIGQLISSQTSALQDSLVSMTSSIRGMFTSLNGWISDQTTALSNKLDEVIGVLNPETDSSASDSLLDQSDQIHAFESSHQDVLSNGLTIMQGASVISRPHFASALSFIATTSSIAFQKLDFMQIIYTLPLVIGLIMFLASRAPGRRHDSPRKVDETKPSRHYQNNDAGGYYRWDGHV